MNPEVFGAQGISNIYRQNLPHISLSGPTYFSHIINNVMLSVKAKLREPLYNILLIITDGEIHDMVATKDLIVACSHLPISIIIVGVGEENF
jgi:Copine